MDKKGLQTIINGACEFVSMLHYEDEADKNGLLKFVLLIVTIV